MVPARGVGVGDGQRDALRALAAVHDDELPGLPDLRNARGDDVQPGDVWTELGFGDNAMHAGLLIS